MGGAFDLIVIGSGTAATGAANQIAAAGWRVGVVDFRPFGGTCALRGCDPKRVLITGAQVVDDVRRMAGRGVAARDPRIDWPELMDFKRTFTDPVPKEQEKHFKGAGIDPFHGRAHFTGPHRIEIEGSGSFEARHFLIATGARPTPLRFPGAQYLRTNEEFLEIDSLPERIALVGGGYIAAEFSHIAARAGAKVTILQRSERLLTRFDPDLVGWLMESFRGAGIDVRSGYSVDAVEEANGFFAVRARSTDGVAITVEADLVVHAAGRIPDLDDLDLDAAQVERDERGHLQLNEFLQSVSNPAVYAAGDAAQAGPPLTPVASHDAKVVAKNLLEGNRHRPDYRGVPSVAFTIPPIARVGLGEPEARKKGLKFRVRSGNAAGWFTARRLAERVYGYKVLIEEPTGHVLGAHLVGPGADEVINLFALAIRHGLTAEDLKAALFAYPTGSSDIGAML